MTVLMSPPMTEPKTEPTPEPTDRCAAEQLVELGWELNASQYRVVHLAARYDDELDWYRQGLSSAALGIARTLQIHTATAREWIRVGHSLWYLPAIDAAFANNEISYAKARILTRWADDDNEHELLALARDCSANRLTTLIARALAESDDNDEERDRRHHELRGFTSYTNGDGMIVIRATLPPSIAKPVLAAVNTLTQQIAQTPADAAGDQYTPAPNQPSVVIADTVCEQYAPADAPELRSVVIADTVCEQDASSDAPQQRSLVAADTVCEQDASAGAPESCAAPLAHTLRELRQRWQPGATDDWEFPTRAQQRADGFCALFLGLDISLNTEIVIHIRGNGNTFDDGTPLTTNAITRQLDDAFIRLMIHDTQQNPIDASNTRRYPTTRQKRLVLEQHNHQCIDCTTTDMLELDHTPPFQQTGHTLTTQLQPRCTPCHRTKHRTAA